jgi:hypothetical protein
MSALQSLVELLQGQRQHDERAHRDVYYLSYPRRLTHLTLHLSKYAARLGVPAVNPSVLSRTLVDTFIIALSAAELLRLDIAGSLRAKGIEPDRCSSIMEVGNQLASHYPMSEAVIDWCFRQLATQAGHIAKALESLDHLEALEYRAMMERSVNEVLAMSLVAAARLKLDLAELVPKRWAEFEARMSHGPHGAE